MDIFAILSLIGGLALFLYGMNVMGDGLTRSFRWKAGKNSGKTDIESNQSRSARCRCYGGDPVIVSYDRYGCRFCKFRDYEAVSGSWNHYGCQCGYYDHIMDPESFRYPKQQFFYPDAEANLIFPDSGNHRSASDDVIKK